MAREMGRIAATAERGLAMAERGAAAAERGAAAEEMKVVEMREGVVVVREGVAALVVGADAAEALVPATVGLGSANSAEVVTAAAGVLGIALTVFLAFVGVEKFKEGCVWAGGWVKWVVSWLYGLLERGWARVRGSSDGEAAQQGSRAKNAEPQVPMVDIAVEDVRVPRRVAAPGGSQTA